MTQGFPGGAGTYATASLAAMTSIAPEQSGTSESEAVRGPASWTSLQKIGFRVLFTVGGGILLLSVYDNLGLFGLFEPVLWLSAQIGSFLIRGHGIELTVSSGGDLLWLWCYHLGWVVIALAIVAVWTLSDRHRAHYRRLSASLWVFARFGLALSMIVYGMAKAIPTQMGYMTLPDQQLQLVGDTSLFNTLWGFMGASEPYSIATGLVELAAGLLLLWNRTWVLGALGSVFAMAQVFLLNMTYDVPVKQVSGELFLIAVAITAPLWPNLVRVVFNRGTRPVRLWSPLGTGRRWLLRTGIVLKFVLAAALTVQCAFLSMLVYSTYKTPTSSLDGVWRATSFTVDGHEATVSQTSPGPWSNVAISHRDKVEEFGVRAFVAQTPDGRTSRWMLEVNGDQLELRKRKSEAPQQVLHAHQSDPDRLVLSGVVEGKQIVGTYERRFMERSKYGFRWVQPEMDPDAVAVGE
ncbi:Uncharacterised protein [Mycobacteroides abscessus subsp. bolletii]|nr:Uncharacterised protein [Mycobacteroides abscessus subsp. bolletii]SKG02311.1 Uncharacterised protein [Mycobacteroides abscessus subsp. bolletii]SKG64282.1 Uncharacterised protein [Mycobacteroides abscessus subsp. bolletii]SKG73720.1 Uncharacterised protein [Mycobacteroides abscessus subsp. bolletii]SKH47284.1 Uncharacterised protein [Mycobacteroides abscessus subsp. bolletii]